MKSFNKNGLQQYINIEKYGLSSFGLKVLAIVTMMMDHIAVMFVGNKVIYIVLRSFGRISFPIFAFLLVEGFFHTSNRKKYAKRLGIFAIISEIPYDLAFSNCFIDMGRQNIFFTLLIGLLAIWALHNASIGYVRFPHKLMDKVGIVKLQMILKCIIMVTACGAAYFVQCTYSYAGVFLIMCFYAFYEQHVGKAVMNGFFNIVMFGGIQSLGTFSVIPIALYNGKQGKKIKWLFYLFYPVHLIIFTLIRII